jgi:SNF2 family DNA or RNA helicase
MTILLPYQTEGVSQIQAFNYRTLLADEMGLGKSIQALAALLPLKKWPGIIVCPAALKLHWKRELLTHFAFEDVEILYGRRPTHHPRAKIVIINYDILQPWLPLLRGLEPGWVIGDEVQMIGNLKTRRTKAFTKLCKGIKRIIGISGTPLTNRPWELFPMLHILCPQEFDSPFTFGIRYCDGRREFGHWVFDGARNLKELHQRLIDLCMVRRTKKEVLPQLPEKRYIVVPLEIENRKEYDRAERDLIGWLAETRGSAVAQRAARAERYTRFCYLKQLAVKGKLGGVIDWISCALSESNDKRLIGCWHHETIDTLRPNFERRHVVIHGGHTAKQRDEAEGHFRNSYWCRLLFGQMQAAGVGINLPECNQVDLAELPWTPGLVQQFIDRCHRLSSTKQVDAHFLIAAGTIEEDLCRILQRKQKILDRTLDGVDLREDSLTIFDDLQKILLKRGKA